MSHIDSMLQSLRARRAEGLSHGEVMAATDSAAFARAALDEVQQRGTCEILDFGARAGVEFDPKLRLPDLDPQPVPGPGLL